MRSIEAIEAELAAKRAELAGATGRETEVYSRIVGYYRSLKNWNKGKKEEFRHRKTFEVDASMENAPVGGPKPERATFTEVAVPAVPVPPDAPPVKATPSVTAGTTIVRYYFRTTCPNCKAMRAVLDQAGLSEEALNVDTDSGYESAKRDEIPTTPHVLFLDENGREVWRSGNPVEVKVYIENTQTVTA